MLDALGTPLEARYLFREYSTISTPYFIHHQLELKDFSEIRLEIFSAAATELQITLKDYRSRSYVAVKEVKAQRINRLTLKPHDFRAMPEEQFFLHPLNSTEVQDSLEIYDSGTANAFIPRRNRIVIHHLTSILPQLPEYNGILRISHDLEISNPWKINGDVIVDKGATLTVRGTNIQINGRILLFGGQLNVEDSSIRFFQTKRSGQVINATRDARVSMQRARLVSIYPSGIHASKGSKIILENVEGVGDLRHTIESGSVLEATRCENMGEIRYDLDSEISINDCNLLKLWLYGGENLKGITRLPMQDRIKTWDGRSVFRVYVKESEKVSWGLRLHPGVTGTILEGKLSGIEVVVPQGYEADFSGIRNYKLPPGRMLQPEFYQMYFNRRVSPGLWNFVAENGSSLVIRNSDINKVNIYGNDTSLTVMQSEIGGEDGELTVELGSRAFFMDSVIRGAVTVATGGQVLAFFSELEGPCLVDNGGSLTLRSVDGPDVPAVANGGILDGKINPPGTLENIDTSFSLPVPVISGMEMGGIGEFLPEISGFEDYENTIIPHFEVGVFNRFFIRFPEFEYVAYRKGSPFYADLSLKAAALFEHVDQRVSAEDGFSGGEGAEGIASTNAVAGYKTPLSFESIASGRMRLFGSFWGSAEAATDPSGQSYRGARFYAELEYLRAFSEMNMAARLYAGLQLADHGYLKSFYSGIPDDTQWLDIEKVSYGAVIRKTVDRLWTFNLNVGVDNYLGDTALSVAEDRDPFDWRVILALIYQMY